MNELMPSISEGIVKGDNAYNDAVDLVNDKNFEESMNKAISAGNYYNDSLSKLRTIQNNLTSDVNQVHKDYINYTISELELKLLAVDKLKDAIDCFKINHNYTGSGYADEANEYMNSSLEYRDARDSLVSKNPKLFKQNSLFK